MLDEVNFYPGNFSVRYGRALAGVVDAHLREARADGKYHGLAQLDFIVCGPGSRLSHEQQIERFVDMRRDRIAGGDAGLVERGPEPAGRPDLLPIAGQHGMGFQPVE